MVGKDSWCRFFSNLFIDWMFDLRDILSCSSPWWQKGGTVGLAVAALGVEKVILPSYPSYIHLTAAAVAADASCRGFYVDKEMVWTALGSVGAGVLYKASGLPTLY